MYIQRYRFDNMVLKPRRIFTLVQVYNSFFQEKKSNYENGFPSLIKIVANHLVKEARVDPTSSLKRDCQRSQGCIFIGKSQYNQRVKPLDRINYIPNVQRGKRIATNHVFELSFITYDGNFMYEKPNPPHVPKTRLWKIKKKK